MLSARVSPSFRSISEGGSRSAQRPVECRGRCARPRPSPARRLGSIKARRLSTPFAVTKPAATSSQSAVSISDFNRRVPRTRSAKNEAPCARKNSSVSTATGLKCAGISARTPRSWEATQSASSRTKKAIGETLGGKPASAYLLAPQDAPQAQAITTATTAAALSGLAEAARVAHTSCFPRCVRPQVLAVIECKWLRP